MSSKRIVEKYLPGDWNVICDLCGIKRKASQCTMQMIPEMPNMFVCTDTCLDKHNEQYDVRGVEDHVNVPIVRDDSPSNSVGFVAVAPYTGPITAAQLQTNGVH